MSTGRQLVPAHPEDPYDLDFTGLAKDLPPPPPKPARTAADDMLIGALGMHAGGFHVVVTRPNVPHAANAVILVVEDDVPTAARVSKVLKGAGYTPAIARTPKAASEVLKKMGPPALILLNVDLPDVDGITFLERIRGHPRLKDTPVVLFTSHSEPDDVIRGLMAGADGYLAKPIAEPALVAAVKTVLGG